MEQPWGSETSAGGGTVGCTMRAPHALGLLVILACTAPEPTPRRSLPDLSRAQVEVLAEGLRFTEGPVWLPEEEALLFSDIPAGQLLRWTAEEGVTLASAAPQPNGNLLDAEGRLLTCRHGTRDVVRTEADGSLTVLATAFQGQRLNSPNDLALAPDGALWFTDPPWGLPGQREGRELPFNGVYRLDPATSSVTLQLDGLAMPNGIAFAPEGGTLIVADTGGHPSHPDAELREGPPLVRAYRVAGVGLEPLPLWETETRCDGMCVTAEGWIWTTAAEGLVLLSSDGAILGTLPLPEAPTNVCEGPDPDTLFVTARTRLLRVRLAPGH